MHNNPNGTAELPWLLQTYPYCTIKVMPIYILLKYGSLQNVLCFVDEGEPLGRRCSGCRCSVESPSAVYPAGFKSVDSHCRLAAHVLFCCRYA